MGETQQGINLSNLNLEQLTGLKQQIEEDVQQLSESAAQLRLAANRFHEGKEASATLKGNKGTLANDQSVMIDIGTGYYAEMYFEQTIPQAQDYADRKVKMITEQIAKLQQALNVKKNNLEAVVQVMQYKISQMNV